MQGISTNQLLLSGSLVSATGNNLYINGNAITAVGGGGGAGITGLSITGSNYFSGNNGMINITGKGSISVFLDSNNIITVSGAASQIATTNSVTGISVTGFPAYTGNIFMTGAGTVMLFTGNNNNILISGDTDYAPATIGYLMFDNNMGQVSAFDVNITGGQISGYINSYSFNINNISIASVYSEYFTGLVGGVVTTGIQNVSFNIHDGLGLGVTGITNGLFNLEDVPYYIHRGNIEATGRMPSLVLSTGRTYLIKNRGTGLLLTGSVATDMFFHTFPRSSFTINSGESYILINGGEYWDIL